MREQGLFAHRPSHRTVTTQSEPGAQVAPNLLQRDFTLAQQIKDVHSPPDNVASGDCPANNLLQWK